MDPHLGMKHAGDQESKDQQTYLEIYIYRNLSCAP